MDQRLQEMLDHHEIRKTLALYCHACDRGDAELMGSIYTDEGSFDDHGIVKGPGQYYAREITAMIESTTHVISHTLGQSLIEVDGDTARAETFFLAFMTADGEGAPRLSQLGGRFVDHLDRVGSGWKVRRRIAVHDLSITHQIEEDFLASNGLVRGSRDAADPGVALFGLAHRQSAGLA